MSHDRDTNLALFIDFDNVALGARDAHQRFDIKLLLQRILEKGKIIVKKAYADWHYYKEHMSPLHESAIELIEIPLPRISGKNSADIRLVVDAMDLCYSKDHIGTFVIVSGDSDFSPLVSKLRENNKRVIGVGVKSSSSKLLISNCDEFIFYDDIYTDAMGQIGKSVGDVPAEKRDIFDFLVKTASSLLQESRGMLYSSLIKDTMTRKQPDFNERAYGYSTFGDLLEDARNLGLLEVERDARAGGTWVVHGLGKSLNSAEPAKSNGSRSRRSRRGGRSRRSRSDRAKKDQAVAAEAVAEAESTAAEAAEKTSEQMEAAGKPREDGAASKPQATGAEATAAQTAEAEGSGAAKKAQTKKTATRKSPTKKPAAKKAATKKTATKKATTKKVATKKTPTKKAATKKSPAKKTATKKAATKKSPVKKTATKKAPAKKSMTKKSPARKSATKKAADNKTED